MSKIIIALLQMVAYGNDQASNLAKGTASCRQASDLGADIVLFPEMWNIGYTFFDPSVPYAQETWQQQALDEESDFIVHFKTLAQELGIAIALTYLEKWPGAPRNTVSVIDRHP